jgi:hypothetical protein
VVFVRDDMLNMVRRNRGVGFGKPAVLATEPGAAPNQSAERCFHEAFRGFRNAALALACKIEMKSMART